MTLLFDANVSQKLVSGLASEYPGSAHVRDVGLREADDRQIWEHARVHGFVIVSRIRTSVSAATSKGSRRRSSGLTSATHVRQQLRLMEAAAKDNYGRKP